MEKYNDLIDELARYEIIKLAKKYNMYFVIWDGHFGRYIVALHNDSGNRRPEIYHAIYESFYDVVGNDREEFRLSISNYIVWIDALMLIRTYMPTTIKYDVMKIDW